MAHNINFNEQTGQHSFFSVKQKAWHGLGQIVQEYPTSNAGAKIDLFGSTMIHLIILSLNQYHENLK